MQKSLISLGGITRPGSLGMISARNLGHPFETRQKYKKY